MNKGGIEDILIGDNYRNKKKKKGKKGKKILKYVMEV